MTENELQQDVCELADDLGLWWFRAERNPRNRKGWPDLVLLGSSALFCELKSADGRRSMAQILVGRRLERAGLRYVVRRPADLDSGLIERELKEIA